MFLKKCFLKINIISAKIQGNNIIVMIFEFINLFRCYLDILFVARKLIMKF